MGIMNAIFGNVSEMDIAGLQKEFGALLCDGEHIERAYKLIRDKWVFTNKRLIIQDIQGVTGKKREYLSVPYRSIDRFSVEPAGTFDMDAEMKIWIRGVKNLWNRTSAGIRTLLRYNGYWHNMCCNVSCDFY